MNGKKTLFTALSWLVTILTPIVILMLVIRALITPLFPRIEYRMPGFPEDPFGFTLEDRLRWSAPSVAYLVNGDDIDDLEALQFDHGEPIYNDRELSHMQDVKNLVTWMRIALWGCVLILGIITLVFSRMGKKKAIVLGFIRGGWGIMGLVVAILIFVVLNFENLFTWFHKVFFETGTWMFYTSDTLIRLFPMRFWQDSFIFVGTGSFLLGLGLVLLGRKILKRDRV